MGLLGAFFGGYEVFLPAFLNRCVFFDCENDRGLNRCPTPTRLFAVVSRRESSSRLINVLGNMFLAFMVESFPLVDKKRQVF